MSKIIQKKFAHLHHHSDQHPARSVEGLGEVEEARTQRRVNDEEHRAQGGGGAARVLVIQGVINTAQYTGCLYRYLAPAQQLHIVLVSSLPLLQVTISRPPLLVLIVTGVVRSSSSLHLTTGQLSQMGQEITTEGHTSVPLHWSRGRVCSDPGWTLVAYDWQSPELRYITIRCGARDSNVTVLTVCTILCSVHCDVLCCKFQTPLCCVMFCMSAIIFRFGLDI